MNINTGINKCSKQPELNLIYIVKKENLHEYLIEREKA